MNDIQIISTPITKAELTQIAEKRFGDMVKAVVDVEKRVMAIGGELHADEEAVLLEQGSMQDSVWGINLYVDLSEQEWIEFDSMINVRPAKHNRSRSVENEEIKKKIVQIVNELIK